MRNKLCAFILTHQRPDKQYTEPLLRKSGYTGPIVYVLDSGDPTISQYQEKYPGRVEIFNKQDYAGTFDKGDNLGNMKGVVYARNACFDIAERLGYEIFFQLDDDYTGFRHTYDNKEPREFNSAKSAILKMDEVLDALVDYYLKTDVLALAFLQGGDLFNGVYKLDIKRKVMNSFILSTKRRFNFVGGINEDVNAYTSLGATGSIMFSVPEIALNQVQTQKSKGGLTEIYLEAGTYVKSFYTILYNPSSVKISMMGSSNPRFHHKINWKATVPKIINQKHKKLVDEPNEGIFG